MAIRSMKVVLSRCILGVLADRSINVFGVAKACRIPIVDLKRLLEFGSALDQESAERLVQWGTRMATVSKPRPGKINQASPKGEASPGHRCKGVKTCHPCR